MREQHCVVAIVQDGQGRFLVTFNARWGGYAFPMIAVPEGGDVLPSLAVRAVEEDLGCTLPNATAAELDHMGHVGVSQRTGEDTLYVYTLYGVEPNQALDLLAAPTWNSNPPQFLGYDEIGRHTGLTWSTPTIARDFVESQEAVLAMVTRAGERETEFLVVHNASYGGFFFPTQRVKTAAKPEAVALGVVRSHLGYRGPATAKRLAEIPDVHFSSRYLRDRNYRFHLCEVQLPDADLHRPGSVLETAMDRLGRTWRWLPGSRLGDPAIPFSPTMTAVRTTVGHSVPARTFAGPLRRSEGGIALIERTEGTRRQWLAQWNDSWKAFFFVGGHRDGNESFRECVVREIAEELNLTPAECPVAAAAAHRLQYRAVSQGAGVLTDYTMELFEAHPTAAALAKIAADPLNKWLDESEIRSLQTDSRTVSVSMQLMLSLAGRIP